MASLPRLAALCVSLTIAVPRLQGAIFYPPVDTNQGLPSQVTKGSTNTMDHFVGYVRGAAGTA